LTVQKHGGVSCLQWLIAGSQLMGKTAEKVIKKQKKKK